MVQIHTSVTLLTSRDLTWSSGRHTCQHASRSTPSTFYIPNLPSPLGYNTESDGQN